MVSRWETVGGLDQHTAKGRLYKDGHRKGLLALPGATYDRHWWWDADTLSGDEGELRTVTDVFGVPVGSIGTLNHWGNSTVRSQMSTLKTNCQTSLFAAGKVHLLGVSAGGLTVLNWAKNNPTLVQSIALLIPVLDVQAVYDEDRGGFASVIDTAYSGRPSDANNPADYAADLLGIPIRVWYSLTDDVTLAAEAEAFAEASGAQLVSMGSVGHFWGPPWGGRALGNFIQAND